MKKAYFKTSPNDPAPLKDVVKRQIRFEEVDMLQIVWHGHYAGFFEDARVKMFQRLRIGYMDLYSNGILAPVKTARVDFVRPLKFMEEISIEGILHYSEASRINTEYIIRNEKEEVAATGFIVQMMLDRNYKLFLIHPEYYKKFSDQWKAGLLS